MKDLKVFIYTNMFGGNAPFRPGNPPPIFSPPPNPYNPTYHSTYTNTKRPTVNWLNSSEAKKRGEAAKAHALSEFEKHFPNAVMSRFEVKVDFDSNHKATAVVQLRDSSANPFLIDRKNWTDARKDALGIPHDGGFPYQLSLTTQNNPTKPIPAVDFSQKIQTSLGDVINKELKPRFM